MKRACCPLVSLHYDGQGKIPHTKLISEVMKTRAFPSLSACDGLYPWAHDLKINSELI